MSGLNPDSSSPVALGKLIALNEEMAALIRAGVPLERGMVELGQEVPGQLGRLVADVGRRMQAGESLTHILEHEGTRFPPLWRAVVESGIRSGDLTTALESMATTGRQIAEWRRIVGLSMIYPLVILATAYAVFVLLTLQLVPIMSRFYDAFALEGGPLLEVLRWCEANSSWLIIMIPVATAFVLTVSWYRMGSSSTLSGRRWCPRALGWLSMSGMLQLGRLAAFAETLSMLVKQRLPLHEAIVLAANSSGDRGLMKTARKMAEQLAQGETGVSKVSELAFPPLLSWVLSTANDQAQLSWTLDLTAQTYRNRAEQFLARQAMMLPIMLTVCLGGTAVAMQAGLVLGPIIQLLHELGRAS